MKQKIDEIEDKFCYYIRWRTCTKLIKKIQEEKIREIVENEWDICKGWRKNWVDKENFK